MIKALFGDVIPVVYNTLKRGQKKMTNSVLNLIKFDKEVKNLQKEGKTVMVIVIDEKAKGVYTAVSGEDHLLSQSVYEAMNYDHKLFHVFQEAVKRYVVDMVIPSMDDQPN